MLTVGEILKKERERKGLTLDQVEKKLKVRKKYLTALENNKWDQFSSKVYVNGLLRSYAALLGISSDKLLAFFRREYEKLEDVHFKKKIANNLLTPVRKKYITVGILILFIIFFGYFGLQLNRYLSPPKVQIIEPVRMSFKRIDRVKISGKTEKEAVITQFGNRIYQDKEGVFSFDFPLHKGKNPFILEVVGANGKKTTVTREFFLAP
ncbi:MAG: helix-turn-helix domain-containing protein [Patescibacteria group bacterium]